LSWIHSDEARINEGAHMPTGVVAELIGLLEVVEDEGQSPQPAASVQGDWA
jgi:hypothetical protein